MRDHNGQALTYVYFEDEPGRRSAAKLVTKDEARSRNPLTRPRTEPDNAQNQGREDSDIKQCINHGSLH